MPPFGGGTMSTLTYRSPRSPPRTSGQPLPLSRRNCPERTPAGTVTSREPLGVITGISPPRTASSGDTCTSHSSRHETLGGLPDSCLVSLKNGCDSSSMLSIMSPFLPVMGFTAPLPPNRTLLPGKTPAGMSSVTDSSRPEGDGILKTREVPLKADDRSSFTVVAGSWDGPPDGPPPKGLPPAPAKGLPAAPAKGLPPPPAKGLPPAAPGPPRPKPKSEKSNPGPPADLVRVLAPLAPPAAPPPNRPRSSLMNSSNDAYWPPSKPPNPLPPPAPAEFQY
mmetsp:Transcript_7017/g.11996  ORF Transcript_7017/g.11996 Transcript_7017/m.11996 type:complete len:279 (+) Transcript_7017:262-1098(+)